MFLKTDSPSIQELAHIMGNIVLFPNAEHLDNSFVVVLYGGEM